MPFPIFTLSFDSAHVSAYLDILASGYFIIVASGQADTEATRLQARTPNACIACQVSAGVVRCSPLVIVPRGPCCCGFRSQALPFLVSGGRGHAMIVGCLLVACVRGVLRRSGSDRLGLVERGTTTICSLGLLVN